MAKKSTPAKRPAALAREAQGDQTRRAILQRAVALASLEGLEGLTIGKLADALKMSKSGLFAHFGSKEELQIATVDAARAMFIEHVMAPALQTAKGMPRLWSLCDLWERHVEDKLFPGGCFFSAASFEFDSRKGPVRDRIAAVMREWLCALARAIESAQAEGHIRKEVRAADLAAEINALAIGGNWALQLLDDRQAIRRSRVRTLERLREVATPACPPLPDSPQQ